MNAAHASATGSPDWSATQYLKFEDERTRPARDLLAQIPLEDPARVVDIGCGPGNSTELLVARWPQAKVSGFDTSPDMIAKARQRLPGVTFELADAATLVACRSGRCDLRQCGVPVVAGASGDPVAAAAIAGDGRRACGADAGQSDGAVACADARDGRGDAVFGQACRCGRAPLPAVGSYYDLLCGHSARLDIWHTIYNHPLADAAAIVEWVKSTGLKPFLDPLEEGERRRFLQAYQARIAEAYPAQSDGKVLLRFPRLFIVATARQA